MRRFGSRPAPRRTPVQASKFGVAPDPLQREKKLREIKPLDVDRIKRMSALMNKRFANSNDPNEKQALAFWKTQMEADQVEDQDKLLFMREFYFWLLGQGSEDATKKTRWGRANVAVWNREVAAYIDQFTDKRAMYAMKLSLLSMRQPESLNEYYLYYKYIVNGALKRKEKDGSSYWDMSDDNYLQDFDIFQQEFEKGGLFEDDPETKAPGGQRLISAYNKKPKEAKAFEGPVPYPHTAAQRAEAAVKPEEAKEATIGSAETQQGDPDTGGLGGKTEPPGPDTPPPDQNFNAPGSNPSVPPTPMDIETAYGELVRELPPLEEAVEEEPVPQPMDVEVKPEPLDTPTRQRLESERAKDNIAELEREKRDLEDIVESHGARKALKGTAKEAIDEVEDEIKEEVEAMDLVLADKPVEEAADQSAEPMDIVDRVADGVAETIIRETQRLSVKERETIDVIDKIYGKNKEQLKIRRELKRQIARYGIEATRGELARTSEALTKAEGAERQELETKQRILQEHINNAVDERDDDAFIKQMAEIIADNANADAKGIYQAVKANKRASERITAVLRGMKVKAGTTKIRKGRSKPDAITRVAKARTKN